MNRINLLTKEIVYWNKHKRYFILIYNNHSHKRNYYYPKIWPNKWKKSHRTKKSS